MFIFKSLKIIILSFYFINFIKKKPNYKLNLQKINR